MVDPRKDKEAMRQVAALIMNMAEELKMSPYPLSDRDALQLAGRVWVGASIKALQETIQDESAILRARSVLLDG